MLRWMRERERERDDTCCNHGPSRQREQSYCDCKAEESRATRTTEKNSRIG